jgi:hypothetical protein
MDSTAFITEPSGPVVTLASTNDPNGNDDQLTNPTADLSTETDQVPITSNTNEKTDNIGRATPNDVDSPNTMVATDAHDDDQGD